MAGRIRENLTLKRNPVSDVTAPSALDACPICRREECEVGQLKRLVRSPKIVTTTVCVTLMLVVITTSCITIEAIRYRIGYASGHVRNGLWTQEQATNFAIQSRLIWLDWEALLFLVIIGITILFMAVRVTMCCVDRANHRA